jgi:hypothetical protein
MCGGGLMQLVAYGAQDVYLTGNPQITFFKVVYRRHTNFAMETIEQTLTGTPDFGRKASVTIIRNGDLAHQLYLKISLNQVTTANLGNSGGKFAWCRRLGHAIIDYTEVEIGGSRIDRQYGTWMDVWYELSHSVSQTRGYAKMIGDVPELTELTGPRVDGVYTDGYTMQIPLQYWFCRNTGLALPLIALQYHEVRVNIEFNNYINLVCYTGTTTPSGIQLQDASLLVNYIYLDSEERRRFAQVGHEYLIEQVQFTGAESVPSTTGSQTSGKYKLGFNHPCKELIWALQGGNFTSGLRFLSYTNSEEWGTAVLDAATNLATGMFDLGTSAASGQIVIDADGAFNTNVNVNVNANQVNVTTVLTDSSLTMDPSTGLISSTVSGVTSEYILLNQNALGDGNKYYLSDKIQDVILSVGLDASSSFIVINTVTVNAYTLNLRDVSIPVANWAVDTRTSNSDAVVNQWNNYGVLLDGSGNPVYQSLIQLNGHDRFDIMYGPYFNYVQPYQHHTCTPADGINVYSFGLHPEQHQPSGTANLSRIDNTQLNLTYKDPTYINNSALNMPSLGFFNNDTLLYVFAFNYNVLRIMSGMGGLAYSN